MDYLLIAEPKKALRAIGRVHDAQDLYVNSHSEFLTSDPDGNAIWVLCPDWMSEIKFRTALAKECGTICTTAEDLAGANAELARLEMEYKKRQKLQQKKEEDEEDNWGYAS